MKNYLIISATVALLFSACNNAEHEKTKHERDSLLTLANQRDSSINEFISSFNDVEHNLDSIAIRQHILTMHSEKKGVELQQNQKDRINTEIIAINKLMDKNRRKIAYLNQKLKTANHKNAELEKTIVTLNNQIAQKNVELTNLNTVLQALHVQVAELQTSVNTLTVENNEKAKTIAEQNEALHTAFYVVGKTKELQEAKVIDRKGGLLGIGRTSKISEDIDNSRFTRIDYTKTVRIPINGDGVKVITSHPTTSYRLDTDSKKKIVRNLVITDPGKFWSASKYLVVVKH